MLRRGDSQSRQVIRQLALLPCLSVLAFGAGEVNPQTYLADIQYLASPQLKGRATGSPELETAANYIANQFKSFGLKPVDGKNFEQPFTVTTNARLAPGNSLVIERSGRKTQLTTSREYVPFSFSSTGRTAHNFTVGVGIVIH